MTRNRRIPTGAAALVALAMVALTTTSPARADENAVLRARMVELEAKQAAMQEEMRQLREQIEAPKAPEQRVEEVERKQNVITEEVRKLRDALVLPETEDLRSQYGLGPAASKVYSVTKGISIGSYGEFNYKNTVDGPGDDAFDMLRLVLYTGYKFNDWLLFNSEVEFEHQHTGEDGDGEVNVEFAAIDMLFDPKINARAGLVLVPMGFLNEMHEPPFFHGNVRPLVEQRIIPTTWFSGGVGFFGEILPGLSYRTYGLVGLDAAGYNAKGIRDGRQEGIENAENFAWVGRLDYSPLEMLTLGGSAFVGNAGQGQSFGNAVDGYEKVDALTQVYEIHGQLRTHGLEARAIGAWVEIHDAAVLSSDENINPHVDDPTEPDQPVAGSQYGWYTEIAYDVLPLVFPDNGQYLAPWFRYERFNTQQDVPTGFVADDNYNREAFEAGITYKPISQVVFKLDYRKQDAKDGGAPDEIRIGAGFVY